MLREGFLCDDYSCTKDSHHMLGEHESTEAFLGPSVCSVGVGPGADVMSL